VSTALRINMSRIKTPLAQNVTVELRIITAKTSRIAKIRTTCS
jgi:hypothetical protein